MFITFEGCEGVGKSTQLRFLKEYLNATGQRALFLREPGGTEISEQIRAIILDPKNTEMCAETETLLYAAARTQLVKQEILPALERGELVICDRFIDSSIAYQGYARGLGADFVRHANDFTVKNCMPDLTVFLNLRPNNAWREVRGTDRIERETAEFHERVYQGYIAQIATSNGRIAMINPDIDKNVTHNKILSLLRERGALK